MDLGDVLYPLKVYFCLDRVHGEPVLVRDEGALLSPDLLRAISGAVKTGYEVVVEDAKSKVLRRVAPAGEEVQL